MDAQKMKNKKGDDWFPLYVDKWLFGSTRHEFTPAQRSVWLDLLALSKKDNGYIRANEKVPYPCAQLAGMFAINVRLLRSTVEVALKVGKLKEMEDGTLYVVSTGQYELSDRHKRRLNQAEMSADKDMMAENEDAKRREEKNRKEIYKEKQEFDQSRKLYPGTKRGLETEFGNFKKHKDWKKVLSLILPAIQRQITYRKSRSNIKGEFIPPWKHFKTWINNRCWEDTTGKIETPEEKKDRLQEQLGKERRRIRDEDSQFYRDRTMEQLNTMLKDKKLVYRHWLIREIIKEKLEKQNDKRQNSF